MSPVKTHTFVCVLNSDPHFSLKTHFFTKSGSIFYFFCFSFETITTKTKNVVEMGFEKIRGTFSVNTVPGYINDT